MKATQIKSFLIELNLVLPLSGNVLFSSGSTMNPCKYDSHYYRK